MRPCGVQALEVSRLVLAGEAGADKRAGGGSRTWWVASEASRPSEFRQRRWAGVRSPPTLRRANAASSAGTRSPGDEDVGWFSAALVVAVAVAAYVAAARSEVELVRVEAVAARRRMM